MRNLIRSLAAIAVFVGAAPATAATIINESFTGGLGAFTASGQAGINNGNGYVGCCGTTGSVAAMSNNFVAFGSGNLPSGLISAPINLVGSQTYTLSFDYSALGAGSESLFATISGITFTLNPSANNNMDTTFQHFSQSFTATGGPTTLQFSSSGINNVDAIVDNILLVGPAPLPEPSTWAMMLVGFGATGLMLRFKRKKGALATA